MAAGGRGKRGGEQVGRGGLSVGKPWGTRVETHRTVNTKRETGCKPRTITMKRCHTNGDCARFLSWRFHNIENSHSQKRIHFCSLLRSSVR